MTKISTLDLLANPDGSELVPVVKGGKTWRSPLTPIVAAILGPFQIATKAARDAAVQAANDAGAAWTGIQAALVGLPVGTTLPLEATSLDVLGLAGSYAPGKQAMVSQRGKKGLWEWRTGDQSPNIGLDPYTALFKPLNTDPQGLRGAWARLHEGTALTSWATGIPDGVTDYHAHLNSLVQHPDLGEVALVPGMTSVGRSVFIGTGKTFLGLGPAVSVLKAVNFTGFNAFPGMMLLGTTSPSYSVASGAHSNLPTRGVRVRDMWIDASKTGALSGDDNARLHALCPQDAIDYVGERCRITDVTGYAGVAFGGRNVTLRDNTIENAQVYLEATNGVDGFLYENNQLLLGDGDIGTEALLHALNGAKRGIMRGNRAEKGMKPVSGIYVVCNSDGDMFALLFDDNHLDIAVDAFGVNVVNAFPARRCEVKVRGGSVSTLGGGIGCANGRLTVEGVDLKAPVTALKSLNSRVTLDGNTVSLGEGLSVGTDKAVFIVDDASKTTLAGGEFISLGGGANLFQIGANCRVEGSPDFSAMPTQMLRPIGVGHKVTRVLRADETTNAFFPVGGALPLVASLVVGCRYRIVVRGSISVPAGGFMIGALGVGAGKMIAGTAWAQTSANDSTPPQQSTFRIFANEVPSNTGNGNGISTAVSTAGAEHRFEFMFDVVADEDQTQVQIYALAYDGNSTSGVRTIHADTSMTVEHID